MYVSNQEPKCPSGIPFLVPIPDILPMKTNQYQHKTFRVSSLGQTASSMTSRKTFYSSITGVASTSFPWNYYRSFRVLCACIHWTYKFKYMAMNNRCPYLQNLKMYIFNSTNLPYNIHMLARRTQWDEMNLEEFSGWTHDAVFPNLLIKFQLSAGVTACLRSKFFCVYFLRHVLFDSLSGRLNHKTYIAKVKLTR